MTLVERPASPEEAAAVLGRCGALGRRLRFRGGGTKIGWGRAVPEPDVEVVTGALDGLVEYDAGDLTAVLGAGMPLAAAQAVFGEDGLMLALDPPEEGATLGGVVATADSGPLRQRYGTVRDVLIGIRVALSDGTLAHSGGKVIKNVAGYDLGKLFAGSFGTLGLVVEVAVRLHPRPARTLTATGRSDDQAVLARGASGIAHSSLQADCLDVAWAGDSGAVLVRFGSADPTGRRGAAAALLAKAGLDVEEIDDDATVWEQQRAGQRSPSGVVVKVSALPAALPGVLSAAEAVSGAVVGRAGLGLSWVRLSEASTEDLVAAVEDLRRRIVPAVGVVLDAPAGVREKLDPWAGENAPGAGAVALMRRVKARFDPAGVCHPNSFVGVI